MNKAKGKGCGVEARDGSVEMWGAGEGSPLQSYKWAISLRGSQA